MKRLWLKSPADLDYLQALAYYEKRQPGLGREFELELEALFARIRRTPEFFPRETPAVRRAWMPRFKHGIYFTMEGDEIGVVAIFSPSQDPARLRRRLE